MNYYYNLKLLNNISNFEKAITQDKMITKQLDSFHLDQRGRQTPQMRVQVLQTHTKIHKKKETFHTRAHSLFASFTAQGFS